jgi:hypothetical protein
MPWALLIGLQRLRLGCLFGGLGSESPRRVLLTVVGAAFVRLHTTVLGYVYCSAVAVCGGKMVELVHAAKHDTAHWRD